MANVEEQEFDRGKFKEFLLLIVQKSGSDPRMGRVKLNKLLFRADFEAYRLLGESITGETYIHGEHGPMAADLPLIEEELGRAGRLGWRIDDSGLHDRKIPTANDDPDTSQFSDEELAIIDAAITELLPLGGRSAREWSHETSAGWRVTNDDEPIPYETALLSLDPIDPVLLDALRRVDTTA